MAQFTIQQAFDLALQHHQAGRLQEAKSIYKQILTIQPGHSDARHMLGVMAGQVGRFDDAVRLIRQALAIDPNNPHYYCNLGLYLQSQGQFDEAIACLQQALVLNPDWAEAHFSLGNIWKDKENFDESIAAYRQAIALQPNYPQAHSNLGSALKETGQLDQAIDAFRQAIELKPDFPVAHSNLLLCMHYHPGFNASDIVQENRRWNQQHAEPLKKYVQSHANDRNPDRRLRVGYVSPDLREHVVARALLPLLASHDHHAFEIFCYAQVPVPDAMTRRLQTHADAWRSIVGLSDQQVTELIRQDRIDILLDLSGHSSQHRLLVFARKPAPVQITWLGYPGSTGLDTMDYLFTTSVFYRPGENDAWYSEQCIQLPETTWCYVPSGPTPEVIAPPALTTGRVTFGCLNNLCKVTPPVLAAWVQILHAMPESDLLLFAREGEQRQRIRDLLAADGIDSQRVRFVGWGGARYFELYQQIDIALDPWPYTGSTTTCDALWMGVPVVSRDGPLAISRLSLAVLSTIGLSELVAHTADDYVRIAVDLANDLPRLNELRSTLRLRMQTSPMMDAPRFARNVEAAYRQMWKKWCAAPPALR